MHPNEQLGWQEFHAKMKKGDKKCLSCHKEFTNPGYPNKGSWLCDVFCWNRWQRVKPEDIPMDTISRIYLLDFNSIEFKHLIPDRYFDDSEIKPSEIYFGSLFGTPIIVSNEPTLICIDDIEFKSNDSKFAGLKHWINKILRRDKK